MQELRTIFKKISKTPYKMIHGNLSRSSQHGTCAELCTVRSITATCRCNFNMTAECDSFECDIILTEPNLKPYIF